MKDIFLELVFLLREYIQIIYDFEEISGMGLYSVENRRTEIHSKIIDFLKKEYFDDFDEERLKNVFSNLDIFDGWGDKDYIAIRNLSKSLANELTCSNKTINQYIRNKRDTFK